MTTVAAPLDLTDSAETRDRGTPDPENLVPYRRTWRPPAWPLTIGAAAIGIIVIGLSYRLSAQAFPADVYYLVFWIGMLGALLPATLKLSAVGTDRTARLWTILLIGVLTAVPKFLRNPGEPRYHDEYAHWREAVDAASAGQLFRPNTVIPIVQYFPGTSALTVTTHSFSGLSIWAAGALVVLLMHILGLFAMFLLGEKLLSSARAGAIAALIYGINPSAIYFDTQYAYESIAINFFLWTLALTTIAARDTSRRRWAFVATAMMTAFCCVVVHHLSTVFLILAMSTVVATATVRTLLLSRRSGGGGGSIRGELLTWWLMWTAVLAIAAGWVIFAARPTLVYLEPYFGNSVDQLQTMTTEKPDTGRQLLAANVQPMWEQLLTAAAPLLLAGVVIAAAMMLRRRQIRLDSTTWGFVVFGLFYFASLPFILAPSGAEGARRSWGFAYVGVALIVAMVVVHRPQNRPRWLLATQRVPVLVTLFAALVVGNVGGGLNDPYRFPSPFRWGTDTNSASDEARTVARDLNGEVGRVRVVSDSYTRLQLAAYGGMILAAPSPGFPAWQLVQSSEDPSPELAGMLVSSDYNFLVVDVRMGEEAPFNGHNFGENDPLRGRATPMTNLTRLDSVPWATRVITTEHLRVYRLDLMPIAMQPRGTS